MPRKPKPFLHQGSYYTTSGGKWRKLCSESAGEKEAARLLAALLGVPVAATQTVIDRKPTVTLSDAVEAYLSHCRGYYQLPGGRVSSEPRSIELAFSYLIRLAGEIPATEVTREHVKAARDAMKVTCSRKTINQHVGRIKRGFRWLAEAGTIPDPVAAAVLLLGNLPAYRSGAIEHDPVAAVPWSDVRPVVEAIAEPWRSLILVQWWSGLRPGEACGLTVEQLQSGDTGETFTLDFGVNHKTGYRGKRKAIALGPQASAVLRPWLWSALVTGRRYVFKTTWIASAAVDRPAQPTSYAHAVERCCGDLGVAPWTPNQLRHSFATRVRSRLGLEAAQHSLGHSRADVTETYAEANRELAARAARLLG